MPNSMFSLDASFPQFTGGESEKQKVGAIYDYLIQLQQTLRYCLQNLGGDNFNEKELEIIGNTIREPMRIYLEGVDGELADLKLTAEGLSGRLEDAEGRVNELEVTAEGYGTRLTNAEGEVADLKLTAEGLAGRLSDAEGNINELEVTAEGYSTRLTNAEGDVADLKLTAEGLGGRLGDAEGRVHELEVTAEGYGTRLTDAEGNILELQETAKGYKLTVSNGKDSSTISLMAGETVLSSQNIKFEGMVTFTSGDDGTAIIDGGKIYSEEIMGARQYVEQLWVKNTNDLMGTRMEWDGINWYVGSVWGTNEDWAYIGYSENSLLINTNPTGGFPYGMVISAAGDLELKAGEEITIGETGKTIRLNGDVYVNGTKIS